MNSKLVSTIGTILLIISIQVLAHTKLLYQSTINPFYLGPAWWYRDGGGEVKVWRASEVDISPSLKQWK